MQRTLEGVTESPGPTYCPPSLSQDALWNVNYGVYRRYPSKKVHCPGGKQGFYVKAKTQTMDVPSLPLPELLPHEEGSSSKKKKKKKVTTKQVTFV